MLKNQLIFEEKKLKEQHYIAYIQAASSCVVSEFGEINREELANSQNKLLLIGSTEVVKNLMVFQEYLISSKDSFTIEKHNELLTELIKSMRNDLFSRKNASKNYPRVSLVAKSNSKKT